MVKKNGLAAVAPLMDLLRDDGMRAALQALSTEDRDVVVRTLVQAFNADEERPPWKPRERWRQKNGDESARAFLERQYMPIPYAQRPYTHELAHPEKGDRPFYNAVTMLVANNIRMDRSGAEGSINAARSLQDLFPMKGSARGGAKQKALPTEVEAIAYVSERRAKAAKHAAAMRKLARKVSGKSVRKPRA